MSHQIPVNVFAEAEITAKDQLGMPPDAWVKTTAYLATLFDPTDHVTFRPIETWTEGHKKKSRVLYKQVETRPQYEWLSGLMAERIKEIAPEYANAFIGVCPRPSGAGTFELAWQIQTVRTLWADVDGCSVSEALQRINAAGLPEPTVVVGSGKGGHFYWKLVVPVLTGAPSIGVFHEWTAINGRQRLVKYINIGGEKVWLDDPTTGKPINLNQPQLTEIGQRVQDTCQGIAAFILGDHTQDLSRLLRLPGTLNRKNERNGDAPRPCELIHSKPELVYHFESFAYYADHSPAKKIRETVATIPLPVVRRLTAAKTDSLNSKVFACANAADRSAALGFAGCELCGEVMFACANAADRSAADFSLCCWAIEKGVSQTDVWAACQNVGKFSERGESYFPSTWSRAEDRVRVQQYEKSQIRPTPIAVSPVVHEGVQQQEPFERTYSWDDLNDIGNAQHYAAKYADELRYCVAWEKWLNWDGARWKIDDELRPLKLATELVEGMFSDVMETRHAQQLKHVCDSAKIARMRALIDLAAPKLAIQLETLDQNGWILNCKNGVVDLTTGELMPHDRKLGITKLCSTEFEPTARSPVWEKFLFDVFAGDVELIQFVQRLFGYFLTGDVSEQKLALFYGTGANGKSTLLNAFMDTIGPDYTMQCMPDFLMEKKGESHPTEKASLFGKRFVSCVETEASRKLAESTVKMLTGGEKIMARRMREDFWEFDPTHKLVLCTNHRPIIAGTDHGIWRRLLLVPFLQRFDGDRQDKQLPEKLKAERTGILAWAVRGYLEWQRIGLNPPVSVTNATEDYRSSEDIFGRFIAECCIVSKVSAVRFSDLYARFEQWANDAGESTPTKRAVGSWLKENEYEKFSSNGRWYRGLMLRTTNQAGFIQGTPLERTE